MFFSDKITLRTITTTQDNDGYPVYVYNDTDAWANVKSVARAEFYNAQQSGISLTMTFEVHAEDYAGQREILYNSNEYELVRAYQKGEGIVELSCKDKAV